MTPAMPDVVAGASRGFTILLVGELLVLLVAAFVPGLAAPGISAVAATAFVLGARRAVRHAAPGATLGNARRGALAALGAYGLTVPLAIMGGTAEVTVLQVLLTSALAVGIGGVAGWRGRGASTLAPRQ
jgi:hypothetical protein